MRIAISQAQHEYSTIRLKLKQGQRPMPYMPDVLSPTQDVPANWQPLVYAILENPHAGLDDML